MKIVLLTTYFQPEVSSVTHLLSDLADDLAFLGHRVTVVTNRPNRGMDEALIASYATRLDEALTSGVRVLRVGPRGREAGGLVKRGLRFLNNTLALYKTAKAQDADVYLINSMPPYLGLAGAFLARRGKKTCFILQDLFPDSIIQMGKLSETGLLTALCRRMERVSLKGNTHLVTISGDMEQTLIDKGVPKSKLSVIPNWADADSVVPVPRENNRLLSELRLDPAGFYVLYAGALGILQTPELILDAAKLTPQTNPEITYLIFGSGGLEEKLRSRIQAEEINNVRLFPAQPISRVPEVYSLGDAALVTLKPGVTKIAMPSKTWTAMAAGRFTIAAADAGSEYASRIREAGGLPFLPGDAEDLNRAVLTAYSRRDSLGALGAKARTYVENILSRRAATAAYEAVLRSTFENE